MKKPNTLDHILALSPVPVLGEISAMRVAEHLTPSPDDYIYSHECAERCAEFGNKIPDRDEAVTRRLLVSRMAGYVLVPFTGMLVYKGIHRLYESIQILSNW